MVLASPAGPVEHATTRPHDKPLCLQRAAAQHACGSSCMRASPPPHRMYDHSPIEGRSAMATRGAITTASCTECSKSASSLFFSLRRVCGGAATRRRGQVGGGSRVVERWQGREAAAAVGGGWRRLAGGEGMPGPAAAAPVPPMLLMSPQDARVLQAGPRSLSDPGASRHLGSAWSKSRAPAPPSGTRTHPGALHSSHTAASSSCSTWGMRMGLSPLPRSRHLRGRGAGDGCRGAARGRGIAAARAAAPGRRRRRRGSYHAPPRALPARWRHAGRRGVPPGGTRARGARVWAVGLDVMGATWLSSRAPCCPLRHSSPDRGVYLEKRSTSSLRLCVRPVVRSSTGEP